VAEGDVDLTAQEQSVTVTAKEQATVELDQPPSPPEPFSTEEQRMWSTEGGMPELAPPIGEVDTGMGGNFSIRGVVRDSSGNAARDVYVAVTYYRDWGWDSLWGWDLLTDEAGMYAFNDLPSVAEGHYEIWFNGHHEYGRVYENSGYYIGDDEIRGDIYNLDVTVHPVTGSAFAGVIQYEDEDGVIKDFLSNPRGPNHFIGLNRGTEADIEYAIGSEYFTDDGHTVHLGGLAGGIYYLEIQYIRSNGDRLGCGSPPIEIPPGETMQFNYIFPMSSCVVWQIAQ
jgi:hypothetical protein